MVLEWEQQEETELMEAEAEAERILVLEVMEAQVLSGILRWVQEAAEAAEEMVITVEMAVYMAVEVAEAKELLAQVLMAPS